MSNSISESWIQSSHKLRARRAFTLVEMMVVLAIILILASIALVNFNSILSTTNSSEFSDFASTLVRARAYAMANNTYVWVGIQEVDASVSDSPGISQSTTGFG